MVYTEHIRKKSTIPIHLFGQEWICRYRQPHNFFYKISKFRKYFVTLLKDLSIKCFYAKVKTPQTNAQVDQVHQVIYNMHDTKYLSKKDLTT